MIQVGIEAMNIYVGSVFLNVSKLAKHRNLDTSRFENLLMKEKAIALPFEDPVSFGLNAAKPIIDSLSEEEKNQIELVVTSTESGIDFGKSLSTYLHHYLGLNRNCRLFEVKNACYSGIAGFQVGVNFVLSQASPGAKALVIATDIGRFIAADAGEALTADWSFAEPSTGAGAVAVLIGETPKVFRIDVGANGYYGYEVCDTCRPMDDSEAGDADLSLMSYLDCCENAFLEYKKRVPDADYAKTFDYLAFHTPFGGMVKGAHRNMMRKMVKARPDEIEADFYKRVTPGLTYCQRVGNVLGATTLLSMVSTIDNGDYTTPKRLGCFSYGSGCCSEFFSGVSSAQGQQLQKRWDIKNNLDKRLELTVEQYDAILKANRTVKFGTRNVTLDYDIIQGIFSNIDKSQKYFLKQIKEFHREYERVE